MCRKHKNLRIFGRSGGILPRAEKQSTGLFFAAVAAALFESRRSNTIPKKESGRKKRPLSFLVGVFITQVNILLFVHFFREFFKCTVVYFPNLRQRKLLNEIIMLWSIHLFEILISKCSQLRFNGFLIYIWISKNNKCYRSLIDLLIVDRNNYTFFDRRMFYKHFFYIETEYFFLNAIGYT